MKVSIIIPIFNCDKYLENSIPQILGQTHKELELILVNDGSTDNSLTICQKFADIDERVKIINKPQSEGAGPARNSGIDAADGDYMMFIDADDYIEENMVECLLNAAVSNDCKIAICGYETYVEGLETSNKENITLPQKVYRNNEVQRFFAEYFPEGIAGYLWNKIYASSLIREKNIRFPDMRRLQDGVFNIDYFHHADSCCIIEDVLYHYRLNAQTDMFRKLPKNYYDLIRQFSQTFIARKKCWGDFSNEKIIFFFLNELGSCLENTFSPQWNMSKKDRNKYFMDISQDDFFIAIIEEPFHLSHYRNFLIKNLKKRNFIIIELVIKLKNFIKLRMRKIFYMLKMR